jgi:hypothetical protein
VNKGKRCGESDERTNLPLLHNGIRICTRKASTPPTNSLFLYACTMTQLPNCKEIKIIIDATFMYKEVVIATFKKHEFVHMCNK